jgi:TnpA family transposase
LTYARLAWVSQNCVRAEMIAAANERLVEVHACIPLVAALGDGHIVTVDGMRFRIPVRSIHADPNPRYFEHRPRRDVAELHERPVRGLHAIVVPAPCATR